MKDILKKLLSKSKKLKIDPSKIKGSASNVDLESSLRNIFSASSRKSIHKYFVILTIFAITYSVGKFAGLFLHKTLLSKTTISKSQTPKVKVSNHRANFLAIQNANLFNAKLKEVPASGKTPNKVAKKPKVNIEKIVCVEAKKKSSLPIKLGDTIVLQDRVKSIASVQIRSKKKMLNIREGEKIENMASISRITRLSIILKNLKTGKCEFVENEKAKNKKKPKYKVVSARKGKKLLTKKVNDSIENTGNKFKIKKSYRAKMLSDMGSLLTQARAVRIDNSDGTMCFKMTEVVAGSLYTQLDIQNEDIVCGINGKKIRSLNELMSLFSKMNEIDHFELSRKRNGEETNIEYNFE